MNKAFKIILLLMISPFYFGQIKRLNDEAIVSQHKRMVFERWGDFRPYGKWNFLGIQTNFAYATVWGMWSPRRNRDYKNGSDIRPLKPQGGKEIIRLAELKIQEEQTKKIKVSMDSIYSRNIADFAHWTPLTTEADPLWNLYYKRKLRPLKEFPDQPQNYKEWGFDNPQIYQSLKGVGAIENLQQELDLLKDKLNMSKQMSIPRGKRFLMYHETMLGWRKFLAKIQQHRNRGKMYLSYKEVIDKFKNNNTKKHIKKTDKEIAQEIINKYKNQL